MCCRWSSGASDFLVSRWNSRSTLRQGECVGLGNANNRRIGQNVGRRVVHLCGEQSQWEGDLERGVEVGSTNKSEYQIQSRTGTLRVPLVARQTQAGQYDDGECHNSVDGEHKVGIQRNNWVSGGNVLGEYQQILDSPGAKVSRHNVHAAWLDPRCFVYFCGPRREHARIIVAECHVRADCRGKGEWRSKNKEMQISVLPSGLLLTTNYDPLQAIVDEEEDLALSEAQAVLASGNVVQLLEANATDSTSVRLLWEVSGWVGRN